MNQKIIHNNQSINQSTTFTFYHPGVWFAGVISSYVCFVLFFLNTFIEAKALHLRSIVLRCAAPPTTKKCFFLFPFCLFWRCRFSPSIFCTIAIFSLYGEYVVRISFQMVYFLVQPCFLKGPTRGKMAMVQKILGEKRYLQNKQKGKRKKHFLVVGASAHRRRIERR